MLTVNSCIFVYLIYKYIKEYICKDCGKIFYSSQAFNGHRSFCSTKNSVEKALIRKGRYQKVSETLKETKKRLREKREEKIKKQHDNFIKEGHLCKNCGKKISTWYGSGAFCCSSCAKSWARKHVSEEKILKNIETWSESNHRHCGRYRKIRFDSSYELAFLIYHLDLGENVKRCGKVFKYVFEGKERRYFPDFEIDGQIYEIKGKATEVDFIKWRSVPGIIVLYKEDLKTAIEYCISKYNRKDFWKGI